MGLDCTLYPVKYANTNPPAPWWLLTVSLPLDRDYDLFAAITPEAVAGRGDAPKGVPDVPLHYPPATAKIQFYADDGIETRNKDAYGGPLRFARAGDLVKILPAYAESVTQQKYKMSPWNAAAFAFLMMLPPETPIIIDWH